jgi:hypothetical protein
MNSFSNRDFSVVSFKVVSLSFVHQRQYSVEKRIKTGLFSEFATEKASL